ncbi:DUF4192 family protein [Streptomyces albidoflavus]
MDIVSGALADFRSGATQLPEEIAARIVLGLQDPETRDAALSTGEEYELPAERQLWANLTRLRAPTHRQGSPAPHPPRLGRLAAERHRDRPPSVLGRPRHELPPIRGIDWGNLGFAHSTQS